MSQYIKSPLNYTGGKYKILKDIIPIFPKGAKRFVDLFAGGLNVGINMNSDIIYVNDQITYLIDLYKYFQNTPIEDIIAEIKNTIQEYNLSNENKTGYISLREEYNTTKRPVDLFLLTCYSFNHQIRFNNSHKFNTPFGKARSAYNPSIEKNLLNFVSALQNKKIILSDNDFTKYDFSMLEEKDLVYCDPPYLITTGSYNDGNRGFKDWSEDEEKKLLELLDKLNERGIWFALSNVFYHKGMSNDLLIEWSKKYNITYIDKTYANCSYHFKDRETKTVEVLITNFDGRKNECQQRMLKM